MFNKAQVIGNAGADAVVRYTPQGRPVVVLQIATNETFKNKETGQREERTEWHRVTFWDSLATIAGEYVKKGRQIFVEGPMRTKRYTDRDGIERWSTGIVAKELKLLGHKPATIPAAPPAADAADDLPDDDE